MTNLQAYRAVLRPYSLPKDTIEFLLLEQGLDSAEDYSTEENDRKIFYTAVIAGLEQLISLEKEKDPGSEMQYNVAELEKRIRRYRKQFDIEDPLDEESNFIDRTSEW